MILEYLFFLVFGYLGGYLSFYIRAKKKLPLIENNKQESIALIALFVLLLFAGLFVWTR
jgi:hypothetical protein